MSTPGGEVEIDVAALRGAAERLRTESPVLGADATDAGRALGDAAAGAGAAVLAEALLALAQRWQESVGGVARSLTDAGTVLGTSVEAHVALDEAGASDLGGPR